jgi:hypothetical protein
MQKPALTWIVAAATVAGMTLPAPLFASEGEAEPAQAAVVENAASEAEALEAFAAPIGGVVRTEEPTDRRHRSEVIALSTLTGMALTGGAVFLGFAHQARNERDAITGDLLIDRHRRSTLQLDQRTHQIAAYALIGTGLAAASGLVYILATRAEDGGEVSLSPAFFGQGAGFRLGATF